MRKWISSWFWTVLVCAQADVGLQPAPVPASATNSTGLSSLATNQVKVLPAMPVSVFEFTDSSRDPFFPHSDRFKKKAVAVTNAPPDPLLGFELILNGITGVPGRRMALINRRAVQAGEETELPGPQGRRIRVRCVEVLEDSVVVLIGNSSQPKTLTLRQ